MSAAEERKRAKRNQNPHKAAVAAMWLYNSDYAAQSGGSMDFWDAISDSRKNICRELVERLERAPLETEFK